MTDEQYKAGLIELQEVFENMDSAETEEEYYNWFDYGQILVNDAIEALDNKRKIH